MANEKMTMDERIEAFYRQSGGPNNEEITRLLEKHLLYANDHGMPGYRETFEDALIDTVVNDPSLLLLYERFQRWKLNRNGGVHDRPTSDLEARLESLEREVRELRGLLEIVLEKAGSKS
jgi:hypothetical protein